MSYSITARGRTPEEAKADVARQLDGVVVQQPVHQQDKEAVLKAAGEMIDLLGDGQGRDIVVTLSGSLGWNATDANGNPHNTNAAGFNVTAYFDWRQSSQWEIGQAPQTQKQPKLI